MTEIDAQVAHHLQTQLSSFDEIMMGAETAFLQPPEISEIFMAVRRWQSERMRIVPHAAAWLIGSPTSADIEKYWTTAAIAGWMPLLVELCPDDIVECRIVKVRVGSSLLGKARWNYRVYRCAPSGRFAFESEYPSIGKVVMFFDRMVRGKP